MFMLMLQTAKPTPRMNRIGLLQEHDNHNDDDDGDDDDDDMAKDWTVCCCACAVTVDSK
jgi:hypothetical protein